MQQYFNILLLWQALDNDLSVSRREDQRWIHSVELILINFLITFGVNEALKIFLNM